MMIDDTHVERFCERDLREGFVTDNVDDCTFAGDDDDGTFAEMKIIVVFAA
jgi:hypothetical protein